MTGLEALQDLSKLVFIYGGVEQYRTIEKGLKALEIIKNCRAIIGVYETVDGKYYLETGKDTIKLCKEDYELLRGVFKC